jgi:hypothetical protein
MKPDVFYPRVLAISHMPAPTRVKGMNKLHLECLESYLASIKALDEKQAAEKVPDGRTLAQLVGHIMEWERFFILAMGEIIAGIKRPQVIDLKGYREPNNTVINFNSINEFNTYQAKKHATMPWEKIQNYAIQTASALQGIFSSPPVLPFELMERTEPYEWHLHGGSLLSLPVAWYIWIVVLEHEVVDHASDLHLD